jgi:hypothetical protein
MEDYQKDIIKILNLFPAKISLKSNEYDRGELTIGRIGEDWYIAYMQYDSPLFLDKIAWKNDTWVEAPTFEEAVIKMRDFLAFNKDKINYEKD